MPIYQTLTPSSGSISFSQIQSAFGYGYSLSSYQNKRWFNSTGGWSTLPTGQISFSDFYGKSGNPPGDSSYMPWNASYLNNGYVNNQFTAFRHSTNVIRLAAINSKSWTTQSAWTVNSGTSAFDVGYFTLQFEAPSATTVGHKLTMSNEVLTENSVTIWGPPTGEAWWEQNPFYIFAPGKKFNFNVETTSSWVTTWLSTSRSYYSNAFEDGGDKLYFFGGRISSKVTSNEIDAINVTTDVLSNPAAALTAARKSIKIFKSSSDYCILFGGYAAATDLASYIQNIDKFIFTTETITAISTSSTRPADSTIKIARDNSTTKFKDFGSNYYQYDAVTAATSTSGISVTYESGVQNDTNASTYSTRRTVANNYGLWYGL